MCVNDTKIGVKWCQNFQRKWRRFNENCNYWKSYYVYQMTPYDLSEIQ